MGLLEKRARVLRTAQGDIEGDPPCGPPHAIPGGVAGPLSSHRPASQGGSPGRAHPPRLI